MGNASNKPKTQKTTERGRPNLSGVESKKLHDHPNQNHIQWAVSSMQGWRLDMEDENIAVEFRVVETEAGEPIELHQPHYFFAILDGHGGKFAAQYASQHLLSILKKRPEFIQYAHLATHPRKQGEACGFDKEKTLLRRALEDAFVELDLRMLAEMVDEKIFQMLSTSMPSLQSKSDVENDWDVSLFDPEFEISPQSLSAYEKSASGTTVTAALVTPGMIICANVGDSRTVLDGSPLSVDHKPSEREERDRILNASGMVSFGRVDGLLAVSRALGDFEFKSYTSCHLSCEERVRDMEAQRKFAQSLKVSPFPDVTCHYRNHETDRCLVLACDGIWDVMSDSECDKFINHLCEEGEGDVGLIAEEVLDACLENGSRDNMTIHIALFGARVGHCARKTKGKKKHAILR